MKLKITIKLWKVTTYKMYVIVMPSALLSTLIAVIGIDAVLNRRELVLV